MVVNVTNEGDMEATVHWHGLRLDNRSDGTHQTQDPIPVGGSFSCRVAFPDPGVYWYHPHIREDYGKEMGLYGNVLVVPADPDHWAPANREVLLTLDDILLEDGRVAPFSRSETTHAAMGRFGDLMLVGGEPDLDLGAAAGRGRAPLPHQHRQHPGLQRRAPRRADEAGGRRQRPLRAGGFVESVVLAPSSGSWSMSCSRRPASWALEHRTPSAPTGSRASLWGADARCAVVSRAFESPA